MDWWLPVSTCWADRACVREQLKVFSGRACWLALRLEYVILLFNPCSASWRESLCRGFRNWLRCEPARIHYPLDQVWNSWITLTGRAYRGSSLLPLEGPGARALMKEEAHGEVEQAFRLSALDVFEASSQRAAWWHGTIATLFETFDFLVLPTAQCFPFNANLTWPRTVGERRMDTYHRWMEVVIPATMAGCPAINVPCPVFRQ